MPFQDVGRCLKLPVGHARSDSRSYRDALFTRRAEPTYEGSSGVVRGGKRETTVILKHNPPYIYIYIYI